MIYKDSKVRTSYSQMDKFLKCQYNWKLRYLDKQYVDVKSKHLEYGLSVHETLEFFFNALKSGYNPNYAKMEALFKKNIAERDIPFDNAEEQTDWITNGLIMLDSLINAESSFHKMLINSEIVGVELPFEIPIETVERSFTNTDTGEEEHHDTVWIVGFIDLVLKTDEGYIVVDHKSGNRKFDKAKLRSDLQFPIYAMAVNHLFGEYPVKAYYNFTKIHEIQAVNIAEEISYEMEQAMNKRGAKEIYCVPPEAAEMQMKQIFTAMYGKSFKPSPTPLCGYCDYGKCNSGICKYSSDFDPKKRKAN